jgi:hypothetical protein
LLIEGIRRSLAGTKTIGRRRRTRRGFGYSEAERVGRRYLERAERIVRRTIYDIETGNIRLSKQLQDNEKQIDKILYDRIYDAIEMVARRKGYNIIYGKSGSEVKKFSVAITTVPQGARVFIMTDLVYRKQLIMKTNPSDWPWTEIVQNPNPLLGKYRYFTVWPNGKRSEGSIDVNSDSALRLIKTED